MADSTTAPVLSAIVTANSKLSDLSVKDGQLIFVQDKNTIALDFGGKRTLYKQIEELATEAARTSILAPVTGHYYFVVETGVLWTYQNGWVQITETPKGIKNYADSASGGALEDAKAYADEIASRVSGSIDDDGSIIITFNDPIFTGDTSGYLTEEQVNTLISDSIDDAIGGSY